ncbi:MAG: radical SAM protein [Thaumarchaeota archaeon]|nr:radical SAM protein [Nitrososphaerota archaeon]
MLDEKFAVRKRVRGRFRIALVYPSTYKVAISNLGLRIIYHLLNLDDRIYCERFTAESSRSLETGSHLRDFDLIMFCYQYEPDLLEIARIIIKCDLFNKPKVVGGPCTCNPFPLKKLADYMYIGEAESGLMDLVEGIMDGRRPEELASLKGVFIPPISETAVRTYPKKLNTFLPALQISSRLSVFGDALLLDVSRGCRWSCLFCLGRGIYAPYRERDLSQLAEVIEEGMMRGGYEAIALISSDLCSYSKLEELLELIDDLRKAKEFRLIAPSLRADALNEKLLEALVKSGEKTITLAPESSEELRYRIGKAFPDERLFEVCKLLKRIGISRVKLYFMFGLPGETFKDLEAIVKLVREIRNAGLEVRVSANPFVPKPHTPMEGEELEDLKALREKLRFLRRELKGILATDGLRQAYLQAVISRGDEKIGRLILESAKKYESLTLTALRREAERMKMNLDEYARKGSEEKPWRRIKLT